MFINVINVTANEIWNENEQMNKWTNEICYPFSVEKCPSNTAHKSAQAKLLKKLPYVSSALLLVLESSENIQK